MYYLFIKSTYFCNVIVLQKAEGVSEEENEMKWNKVLLSSIYL